MESPYLHVQYMYIKYIHVCKCMKIYNRELLTLIYLIQICHVLEKHHYIVLSVSLIYIACILAMVWNI